MSWDEVVRDMAKRVTRRRGAQRAEEVLRESEERFRTFVESAFEGVVISEARKILAANESFARMFGYEQSEVIGLSPSEMATPESARLIRRNIRSGFEKPYEIVGVKKDGTNFDLEVIGKNCRYQGRKARVVAFRDVSDRKRAQEALREREEWLSTILSSIGDAVIATCAEGRVTFLNPAAQSLTGWTQEEAAGKPLGKVFNITSEETGKPVEDPVAKVMREGVVVGLANHSVLIARDGTRRPIDDSSAPIRDSQGNIIGVVLVFHDASQQRWASEELRRLTARLLEVQEEDRRQVAYDIHDGLGQLMTAASMHLESYSRYRGQAQSAVGDKEFAKARSCLQDAVVEMRRLVSELGPLLLEGVGLMEASRRLLGDMAERANWETEFEGEADGSRLDPMAETALYRIVQEALSNVTKHAHTEKVRIAFKREKESLRLEIRDWGCGFDPNSMPERPEAGRRVGLLGMRERAVLIGGELSIESSPGKGTSIVVTVPVAAATAPVIGERKAEVVPMVEARKGRGSSRQEITVLIADDHPMVREGLRSMLDADEIEIVGEAADGAEAVERVQQLNPDVVLMDVRMPDMDGLAATEIIKQGLPETSVIVITSYESKDYLRRAIAAGAAGYLLKGMSRDSLIEAIRLVRGGGALIDARLLSELLREMGVEGSRFQGAEGALEALTPREQEVLQLLVRGLTNKEIAAEMRYSVGTVKNVVQRVIEKLGVSDRTQAAVYAVRAGMNPPP